MVAKFNVYVALSVPLGNPASGWIQSDDEGTLAEYLLAEVLAEVAHQLDREEVTEVRVRRA
jgi:hypothetical protein